jgi:hypothetical protein
MLSEGAKGPIQQVEPPVLALTKLPRGNEISRNFPFWPIVMKFVVSDPYFIRRGRKDNGRVNNALRSGRKGDQAAKKEE